MIGKLKGLVDTIGDNHVILDVGGVGYVTHCSALTLQALPALGTATTLIIETHVREDAISLFGFSAHEERDCFKLLSTVQGVGARVAMAILSVLSVTDIIKSILVGDAKAIMRADGVGQKLAQRIVNELAEKVNKINASGAYTASGNALSSTTPVTEDVVSALVNLGYRRFEAEQALGHVLKESPILDIDHLLRSSLQRLAS